jgi:tyrosinase
MVIRKDANTLSRTERDELVAAILQLKVEGIYDQFVLRHANANMGSIHSCPAFLPWHRRFLWDFEQELQRVSGNSNLGVPYWNWTSGAENASMWDDDFLGGDGDASGVVRSGPFRSGQWVVVNSSGRATGPLERGFGRSSNVALPTEAELQQMLRVTPYDARPWDRSSNPSFRNLLEGWQSNSGPAFHNLGHVWAGGSMLPMTSPNDPLFFLHHCMVDKMWHEWQLRFPAQGYLPVTGGAFGQNLNDVMDSTPPASIGRRPIDVLDSTALEIQYDRLLSGTPTDSIDPPATETELTSDANPTPASISRAGEVDLYGFNVASFDEYTIETTGSSDTFMTLYGPNNATELVAQNDDGGENLNSKISLNLSAGRYFVAVRLYSPTITGDYAIKVASSLGNSRLPELIINAEQTTAAISVGNESDVYRFRVESRAQYTIETTGSTDVFLSLSGPNDENLLIEQDDDSGANFNSRIRLMLSAGEYYARVRHFSPDGMGAYSIGVRRR